MREKSIYFSKTTEKIWEDFSKPFKHPKALESYYTDIQMCCDELKCDFLELTPELANEYYMYLKQSNLHNSTRLKKIRELSKFSKYILENNRNYNNIPKEFYDFFYKYTSEFEAGVEPGQLLSLEDMDRVFDNLKSNPMHYAIVALVYRTSLKISDICKIKEKDFYHDPSGTYVNVITKKNKEKKRAILIPEDVIVLISAYRATLQEEHEYFFLNTRKKPITELYLQRMIAKVAKQLNMSKLTFIDIRRTGAAMMYRNGASDNQMANQLGVTERWIKKYDRVVERDYYIDPASSLVNIRIENPNDKI